ncbi:MAG: 4Fe-4S binding protein [Ignavibacteria bacterium]|jgi:NADH-quinone oxidoreductase subunit G|nr:4Fe-4S binding protein [Ignavibacteria bacterium]MCU7501984.1 4Fe-4S binding protein [Ignavibacteria bacterium]MCU7516952.1 4Fe-4S binding protein [Ignavibacteria bacterium]
MENNFVTIDGRKIPLNGEKNLLEIIRKAGIDLPTFCYHSELSVYGACRLCLVELEGRGIISACSTKPEPGMKLKTTTQEIREIRKITLELLLANGEHHCPTCVKSGNCKLQDIARRHGVEKIRFKRMNQDIPLDDSTHSLLRDPNKCILCGDCVRACSEIQSIGAIDFAFRGSHAAVLPAFGKKLEMVECIDCGQCARVCPTGAITPKSEINDVWKAISDPTKTVIAQIAPAVRVAIGEMFNMAPGVDSTGQIVAALKIIGFDKIFDTSFAADLTIVEEASELLHRIENGGKLPQFTSCCPGWVKFAEQYFPDLLPNLSSCRSPQQMFGSLAKETLTKELKKDRKDLVIVSIMPCTAKKFEARRPEFSKDGVQDVDFVLTTQELGQMIDQAGILFNNLEPESLDMPFGFKTGAGVIFGNSGGVMEAALRFVYEKLSGQKLEQVDFHDVRGMEGLREVNLNIAGKDISVAVVHGLKNARAVAEKVKNGQCTYDFIEVMSCPNGCIGGAGQPVTFDMSVKAKRTAGLYSADKNLQIHKSQDNPFVVEAYNTTLESAGSHKAHELLHTSYSSRRRVSDVDIQLLNGSEKDKLQISVCVGTSCYLKGSQDLLHKMIDHIDENNLQEKVDIKATFCLEQCDRGPSVTINGNTLEKCTLAKACQVMNEELAKK